MEQSRAAVRIDCELGHHKLIMMIFSKLSPPNVLIVVSTMLTTTLSHVEWVGGPVRISPGFPLKAYGNDGLGIGKGLNSTQRATGIEPTEIESESVGGGFQACPYFRLS